MIDFPQIEKIYRIINMIMLILETEFLIGNVYDYRFLLYYYVSIIFVINRRGHERPFRQACRSKLYLVLNIKIIRFIYSSEYVHIHIA